VHDVKVDNVSVENNHAAPTDELADVTSISELKNIVWSQWDHIDDWRRLCASQKDTIEKLTLVNARQHEMLQSRGLSSEV
jgi:hypothetical protein